MRNRVASLGLGLATLVLATPALALNQPDGTPIPQGNGLQGLFDFLSLPMTQLPSWDKQAVDDAVAHA